MIRGCIIMSVYRKNDLSSFKRCIRSLDLNANNLKLLLAVDGPLPNDLCHYVGQIENAKNTEVFWFEKSAGLTKRLNYLIAKALESSAYEYFFRMDADDVSTPDRFAVQTAFMDAHPDVDLVASHSLDYWENGETSCRTLPKKHDAIVKSMLFRNPIKHSTVCMRRRILEKHRYNEKYLRVQDRVLWTDIIRAGGTIEILDEQLVHYYHDASIMDRRKNWITVKYNFLAHIYTIVSLKPFSVLPYLYLFSVILSKFLPGTYLKKLYKRFDH